MVRPVPFLLVFGLALSVGCSRQQPATTPAEVEAPAPHPAPTPDVKATPHTRIPGDAKGFKGTVIQTTDAGTLLIRPVGEQRLTTVRLIGLTPPVKATRDKDGQEPWATRGQQALAVLLVRKDVRVEYDVLRSEMGHMGVWGYVWLEGKEGDVLANEAVLANGHAVLDTRVPNVKYVDRLTAAQKTAREAGKNIWNSLEPLTESPADYAKRVTEDKPIADTLAKWEEGCVIGNKMTKKYHVPGGQYYNGAKTSANAIFFKNEDDAKAAGYEKSAR